MCKLDSPKFQDDTAAREYLEATLWPNGPVCPHCGSVNNAYTTKREGLYRCAETACKADFTVTVGTVFERSKIPLHKWLLAAFLICSSKKGMSSLQLQRTLGVTYKTAWFMTHRLREAMDQPGGILGGAGGAVEVDETYWGNVGKQAPGARGWAHKMKVVSLVERDGKKHSHHVANVTADTLRPILEKQVSKKARLMTDQAGVYTKLGKEFAEHGVVNHSAGEYARGDITTNTVESSFAILKRGLYGTFHNVSEQHLQRYVNEFDFKWNHRETRKKIDGKWVMTGFDDSARTAEMLKGAKGKRLTYKISCAP